MKTVTRLLVLVPVLVAAMVVAGAQFASGSLQVRNCSISAVAERYGLSLSAAPTSAKDNFETITVQVLAEYPDAQISERTTSRITSSNLPLLNERVGNLVRVDGAMPFPVGATQSPDGKNNTSALSPDAVICTVSIFDADTGEFLVTLQDVYPGG